MKKAIEYKEELEKNIAKLLTEFYNDTGLVIHAVEPTAIKTFDMSGESTGVYFETIVRMQ